MVRLLVTLVLATTAARALSVAKEPRPGVSSLENLKIDENYSTGAQKLLGLPSDKSAATERPADQARPVVAPRSSPNPEKSLAPPPSRSPYEDSDEPFWAAGILIAVGAGALLTLALLSTRRPRRRRRHRVRT